MFSRFEWGLIGVRLPRAAAEPQDQMQRALLLYVVVLQRSSVLHLFSGKNESLLVRRDPLFVLDLALDHVYRVRRFDLQSYGFTRQCFDKNLHIKKPPNVYTQHRSFGKRRDTVLVLEETVISVL